MRQCIQKKVEREIRRKRRLPVGIFRRRIGAGEFLCVSSEAGSHLLHAEDNAAEAAHGARGGWRKVFPCSIT